MIGFLFENSDYNDLHKAMILFFNLSFYVQSLKTQNSTLIIRKILKKAYQVKMSFDIFFKLWSLRSQVLREKTKKPSNVAAKHIFCLWNLYNRISSITFANESYILFKKHYHFLFCADLFNNSKNHHDKRIFLQNVSRFF